MFFVWFSPPTAKKSTQLAQKLEFFTQKKSNSNCWDKQKFWFSFKINIILFCCFFLIFYFSFYHLNHKKNNKKSDTLNSKNECFLQDRQNTNEFVIQKIIYTTRIFLLDVFVMMLSTHKSSGYKFNQIHSHIEHI